MTYLHWSFTVNISPSNDNPLFFSTSSQKYKSSPGRDGPPHSPNTPISWQVRDGGGVEPDVFVPSERISELELSLLEQNAFLSFASDWAMRHPGELEKKGDAVVVDDKMYAAFQSFVETR